MRGDRRYVTDVQLGLLARGRCPGCFDCFIYVFQHGASLLKKHATRVREANGFCGALKQIESDVVLEISNLRTKRRLRNVKLQRRARDVFQLRDGDKVAQMPEFHRTI